MSPITSGIEAAKTVASAFGSPKYPVRRPVNPLEEELRKPVNRRDGRACDVCGEHPSDVTSLADRPERDR